MAEIELYPDANFEGEPITLTGDVLDLKAGGFNFNDKISSVVVRSGTFTLYRDFGYQGPSFTVCKTGGPSNDGAYPHPLWMANFNDAISSVRKNSDDPA